MATEQQIQKKITKYLEGQGCYVVKVISASKSGVPDILGFAYINGLHFGFAIEVKKPSTKYNVSELQKYNLHEAGKTGALALVAWDVPMVKEGIDEYVGTHSMGT